MAGSITNFSVTVLQKLLGVDDRSVADTVPMLPDLIPEGAAP